MEFRRVLFRSHVHVAEQEREVKDCLAWSGARPIEWLLGHAPVDGRWCLVHATQMTPSETVALASSDAVVGLCPTTEANLGDGLFDLPRYLGADGKLGIGSDRSEEHTSELQSLMRISYAVFCLKKKKPIHHNHNT